MKKESEKFADSALMEGMNSIRAVISGRESGINNRIIEKILFDREKAAARHGELGYLRAISSIHGFTLQESDAETIDAMTVGNTHGGIIAVCGGRDFAPPDENVGERGFYMLLDGIEDPYNFGYALRSIYAAGADGIILPPRNWMSAAGVVARASAGASERMRIFVCEPSDALEFFKKLGYKVYAAEKKDAESVYKTDLRLPLLMIVGGEKRGISSSLLSMCDARVRLDYGRDFPAALSAASAASILAFEVYRQNSQ